MPQADGAQGFDGGWQVDEWRHGYEMQEAIDLLKWAVRLWDDFGDPLEVCANGFDERVDALYKIMGITRSP